ncbi:hypothetical protein FOBRF1_010829 [Fusarium oxysporum]
MYIQTCSLLVSLATGSLRQIPLAQKEARLRRNLFALGTGICEITEWDVPYCNVEIEELQEKLMRGEYPHITEDNPAQHIIRGLWKLDYSSVQEAAKAHDEDKTH